LRVLIVIMASMVISIFWLNIVIVIIVIFLDIWLTTLKNLEIFFEHF
jgi:hypothetical protein